MEIEHIAIIGAGQMGNGIAQVSSCAGYRVTMIDIKEEYDLMTEEVEKSTTDKRIQKWWQILTKNR